MYAEHMKIINNFVTDNLYTDLIVDVEALINVYIFISVYSTPTRLTLDSANHRFRPRLPTRRCPILNYHWSVRPYPHLDPQDFLPMVPFVSWETRIHPPSQRQSSPRYSFAWKTFYPSF